jgi:outer membrane receptor protein involved in Fe transport
VTFTFTAFQDRVEHAIANVTVATNTRQRQNVDAIRARGLELGTSVKLGQFAFDGSLALTDAKVEASGAAFALNGLRPAQTPKIAASGTLSGSPPRAGRWR